MSHSNLMLLSLAGVRTTGLLPRGIKREVGFPPYMLSFNKQRKCATNVFTALFGLSGPTGKTKSPKSFQPRAGHPQTVQEESGELRVLLEVLCLKLSHI